MTIEIWNIRTPLALQAKLKNALHFPDFYGMNWDAFCDAATGLAEMPRPLILHGFDAYRKQQPSDAECLKNCVADLAEQWKLDIRLTDSFWRCCTCLAENYGNFCTNCGKAR